MKEYNVIITEFNHITGKHNIERYNILNRIELLNILERYHTEPYHVVQLSYNKLKTLKRENYIITDDNRQIIVDKIDINDLLPIYIKESEVVSYE